MGSHRRFVPGLLVACGWAAAASAAAPVRLTWTVDGVEREALVYAPPNAPATSAHRLPVVFGFHGHGGNMQGTAQMMRFQQLWPQAIAVYPQGLPSPTPGDPQGLRAGWQFEAGDQGGRDLKFFDQMLATLHAKYPVDDRRIYSAGFSNGAMFSLLLWTERGKLLAAIGPCAGILLPANHPSVPRPVAHIAGQADTTAVFADQVTTMATERQIDGCSSTGAACGAGCKLYPSTLNAPVMNVIHPGGHVYPPWATGRFVAFFKAHPLP